MKHHQAEWARANGFATDWFDDRHGPPSWVLKGTHQKRNMYRPEWWCHIVGREHRWSRALNSSQCFAVNVFAPLIDDPDLAKHVLAELLPQREILGTDHAEVAFEYTPEGTDQWLGESGYQTQVDVFFTVRRDGLPLGHLLVEVKLSETGFGSCRGARRATASHRGNPDPLRCLDVGAVLATPQEQCWLTAVEGRRYWERMLISASTFDFNGLPAGTPCPFRHGLYQLMRNRVLADALVAETRASWADVAICIHPENDAARKLPKLVGGREDVLEAFTYISSGSPVREINPGIVISVIRRHSPRLADWADWMRQRYLLP
jgi:hypothetical protein